MGVEPTPQRASAGQYLFLVPALDLIVVQNGNTGIERRPHVVQMISEIIGLPNM